MSLVSPNEITGRYSTGLDEEDLQTVIDQQESWLARKIGALTGERTLTFYPDGWHGPIYLPRVPDVAADFTVVIDGSTQGTTTYRLTGFTVERVHQHWRGTVETTFTPDDEDDVRAAIFDLVRLTVTDSPYAQESGEGHQATRMASYQQQRARIARSLQPHIGPVAVSVREDRRHAGVW